MTNDEIKRELEQGLKADFEALAGEKDVHIELDAQNAYLLLNALQHAYHHTTGTVQELVERMGRELQASYCPAGSMSAVVADQAWRTESILPKLRDVLKVPPAFRAAFGPEPF